MAATVQIRRLTGVAAATSTDITNISTRANAEDAHSTAGTTNPIQIPASGTNYSFWVITQLFCSVAASVSLSNLKWFSDGANGLGTGVTAKVNTASGYVQASGTVGTTGLQLTVGNYATLAGAPTDAFAFTSAAPLSVAGSLGAATGAFGDRVVYQLEVVNTAVPGATAAETWTWRYDEI